MVVNRAPDEPQPKIRSMSKLWTLFDEYVDEVRASRLALGSQVDYISFAEYFVRWLDGEYNPGQGIKD